jgi:hypothetical protein
LTLGTIIGAPVRRFKVVPGARRRLLGNQTIEVDRMSLHLFKDSSSGGVMKADVGVSGFSLVGAWVYSVVIYPFSTRPGRMALQPTARGDRVCPTWH